MLNGVGEYKNNQQVPQDCQCDRSEKRMVSNQPDINAEVKPHGGL